MHRVLQSAVADLEEKADRNSQVEADTRERGTLRRLYLEWRGAVRTGPRSTQGQDATGSCSINFFWPETDFRVSVHERLGAWCCVWPKKSATHRNWKPTFSAHEGPETQAYRLDTVVSLARAFDWQELLMPAEFTGAHVPFPEGWVAGDPGGTWLPERVCEVANGESRLVQPIPPSIAVPGAQCQVSLHGRHGIVLAKRCCCSPLWAC